MDAQLNTTQQTPQGYPLWDFLVVGGNVPIPSTIREQEQQAACAAFTNLNAIPQLPGIGVDWTGAMTGNTTFGTIDSQINTAIANCNLNYGPVYGAKNGNLTVTINQNQVATQ